MPDVSDRTPTAKQLVAVAHETLKRSFADAPT